MTTLAVILFVALFISLSIFFGFVIYRVCHWKYGKLDTADYLIAIFGWASMELVLIGICGSAILYILHG